LLPIFYVGQDKSKILRFQECFISENLKDHPAFNFIWGSISQCILRIFYFFSLIILLALGVRVPIIINNNDETHNSKSLYFFQLVRDKVLHYFGLRYLLKNKYNK